ncbi:hypothetical protein SK854_07415 [Lentzea sp. BCCO 10_0061]|uniref:Uncharacterized protein n=1 Tax=Lentzea sokolovensis TaxID=3095429 RepID=A0ABU4USZ0_9PSEU|nr:hypothetical protein [Lentzea sp. BCCO 10_0061]MDX8141931.1 hypothetical protein [Lentzea sp. BCCO 10_0061]
MRRAATKESWAGRFEPVSAEQWRRELVELSAVDDVVIVDMTGHVTAVAEHGSTMARWRV